MNRPDPIYIEARPLITADDIACQKRKLDWRSIAVITSATILCWAAFAGIVYLFVWLFLRAI